ncbi:uracil-DNA glycosylase [Campylobacter curvus]|uniref:uracil-DNA glycosylase n=1 Tax=Campylobacter curvus TaxID=200 RepID=UPI000375B5B7|nr:uracil-DNA glycosylase [Campylobacter curvus]QKF61427.1 uracil-DNA glycosylase, family 4 [Campylobacter curvus]UEB49736.1 uracil-DNA glycosylase [Campylobacter curvus]
MKISQRQEALKKLYFLKAVGYKFINENFINLYQSGEFSDLNELNKQISHCALCALRKTANRTILGLGDKSSKVMFVSLAPSISEDQEGEHLCGMAGIKLCEMIYNSLGLKKGEFYISSILRCKFLPNEAQNAATNECFELCRPYLLEEIRLLKPKVIVALGEQVFLNLYPESLLKNSFESIRGSVLKFGDISVMPTYSHVWLMKNPSFESVFLDDLRKIKGMI